jgi:K(+)-stimulated pyrophosphate-energized sodium pump
VTVQYWVYFFLGVSVLSLVVAFFFARQVVGSYFGTPKMQKIAGAIKEGAEAFLKRQYKTSAALLGLLLPTFAYAQPDHAGGGEANLVLPDLSTVNFLGMNGHALLIIGLLF